MNLNSELTVGSAQQLHKEDEGRLFFFFNIGTRQPPFC